MLVTSRTVLLEMKFWQVMGQAMYDKIQARLTCSQNDLMLLADRSFEHSS
jgi:hypothetical protein